MTTIPPHYPGPTDQYSVAPGISTAPPSVQQPAHPQTEPLWAGNTPAQWHEPHAELRDVAPGPPRGPENAALDFALRAMMHDRDLWPALDIGHVGSHSAMPHGLLADDRVEHALLWDAYVTCRVERGTLGERDLLSSVIDRLQRDTQAYQAVSRDGFDRLLGHCYSEPADAEAGRQQIADVLQHFLADVPECHDWLGWHNGTGAHPRDQGESRQQILQQIEEFRAGSERRGPYLTTEFRQQVQAREELITGVLVARQVAVIGAATKLLKTLISLDMAVTLATGTCWLGHPRWRCQRPLRVGFFSAESGAETLLCKHDVIAQVKQRLLGDDEQEEFQQNLATNLIWDDRVPDLGSNTDLDRLRRTITDRGIEVLFLDPLSMAIGSAAKDLANLAVGGQVILRAADLCRRAGCTLVLIHHTSGDRLRLSGDRARQPVDLTDLAYPAISNHARQWVTLSRAEPYDEQDRRSELWLRAGGSGLQDGGTYYATITEGRQHDRWQVEIETESGHIERERDERDAQQVAVDSDERRRVLDYLRRYPGASRNRLVRDSTLLHGIGDVRIRRHLVDLQSRGAVRQGAGPGSNAQGWYAVEPEERVDDRDAPASWGEASRPGGDVDNDDLQDD